MENFNIDGNSFVLEITEDCNMNCVFCYNYKDQVGANKIDHGKNFIDFKSFTSIVKTLISNGANGILLSGGEPLLHPNIWDMLQFLDRQNVKFRRITNGLLIDKKLISFLINKKNVSIQISLDGAEATTHDALRCEGSFDHIISVINELHSQGFERGILRTTITKQNYRQIAMIYKFAKSKNFFSNFSFVQNFGNPNVDWNKLVLDINEISYVYNSLEKEVPTHEKSIVLDNLKAIIFCPLLLETPLLKPFVNIRGEIKPCHMLTFSFGNLLKEEYADVFSIGLTNMTLKLKQIQEDYTHKHCKQCIGSKLICKGGCIGIMMEMPKQSYECQRICNLARKVTKHVSLLEG